MNAPRKGWPTMGYYDWLEWCEAEGADPQTRVFVPVKGGVAEWYLTPGRFDGQPPLNAFVTVPVWALARVWERFTSPSEVRGRPGERPA